MSSYRSCSGSRHVVSPTCVGLLRGDGLRGDRCSLLLIGISITLSKTTLSGLIRV